MFQNTGPNAGPKGSLIYGILFAPLAAPIVGYSCLCLIGLLWPGSVSGAKGDEAVSAFLTYLLGLYLYLLFGTPIAYATTLAAVPVVLFFLKRGWRRPFHFILGGSAFGLLPLVLMFLWQLAEAGVSRFLGIPQTSSPSSVVEQLIIWEAVPWCGSFVIAGASVGGLFWWMAVRRFAQDDQTRSAPRSRL
jgi:hypothetical protein